jgi:two-component system CheB/CheR fusion protein
VGIGASAGGLEALRQFLQALPPDTGLGFVVVQHLAPAHPSALAEILSRATPMPVLEVHDEPSVRPNHVYVIPPGRSMTIARGALHLLARERHGQPRPIDQFFQSLAEEQAHQAIGVVLSGTATDGTLGLEAIKAAGGITFAQDETAQHTSMPRSAIATGCVDLVLPPHEIAREIARIARHPYVQTDPTAVPSDAETLDRIVQVLHRETGVDFSQYKSNTLYRRVTRRVVLHRLGGLPEYLQFLESNPPDVAALQQDILIGVTSFFRDRDAFAALQSTVMPRLFKGRLPDEPVRIWVLGCSSGEEAYSLAIALTEVAEAAGRIPAIQVFATDVSAPGIEKARSGVYPKTIAQDVSPERLRRFFVDIDGHYRVTKAIRDRCVFARHNALVDPPFSRVDLISCRNLLIYLVPPIQQRVVTILHYALKPEGVLWLGGSETIGPYRDLFEASDVTHKIFTKRPGTRPPVASFVLGSVAPGLGSLVRRAEHPGLPPEVDVRKEAERLLLGAYAPPGVLITAEMEIRQIWGDTGAYLAPAPGQASLNLLKMLREGLLASVRSAVMQARSENRRVRTEGLRVKDNGGFRDVTVDVIPLGASSTREGSCLVLFADAARRGAAGSPAPPALEATGTERELAEADGHDEQIFRLARELTATREYLQAIIEQQEAANEELQTSHEEAQSANEELQSINEELETSKEEIQSSNEELATVNDELNHRNLELGRANNDLTNLIASVQMAVVMLGPDLRIRRFTPLAEKLFNLIPSDLGRPMRDIQHGLLVPELEAMLAQAIDLLEVGEREVQDRDGRWYLVRVRPYKTLENQIDGAVVMVMDIDSFKRAHEYAEATVATARSPLLVLDSDMRVQQANRAFYDVFDTSPSETEGQRLFVLGNGQWNIPALRRLLEEVLPHDQVVRDFEVEYEIGQQGRRVLHLNARRLIGLSGPNPKPSILLSIEDVTAGRQLEEASRDRIADLAAADRAKDEFLAMLAHELRNPLGPLRSALQLAKHPKASAETVADMWNIMDRQVGNLTRLVDDLLDVARVTRGRISMRKAVVDLVPIVRQAVKSMDLIVAARAQELSLVVVPRDSLFVEADTDRLEQVFGNLLNNASKFNREGGRIWVTVDVERGEAPTPASSVVVRVRDDGFGIDAEMLPRVFDLFTQADHSLAHSRGGLGIGLTIVRRVVEQHGGRIEARSAGAGDGSEFVVRLPLVSMLDPQTVAPMLNPQAAAGASAVSGPAEPEGPPRRVLVVDDSVDSVETLARLLRADGHNVFTAMDGPSALAIVHSFRPDVVLLDIGLPGMNGYETAMHIRRSPGMAAALLIALTGYGQDRDRARALEAGFDRHLTKPVDHQMLLRLIQSPRRSA